MRHLSLLRGLLIIPLLIFTTAIIAQPDADLPSDDQQILDDLIVVGSGCFGQDCSNGESFGFDTIRLKENNLRIKFQDTSTSASFPSNDWQLTANDSSNGGANKFSIDDITGGRTPFTIEASAPSHSLYVDDGGRLGLGTSTPVTDIHVKSGNTPTLRLEQDGTSGFAAQTWDLAGNEANFFMRDASNGSTLPFRIFPAAPSNSLIIEESTGDIGIGTTSPTAEMHILQTGAEATELQLQNNNGTAQNTQIRLVNTTRTINQQLTGAGRLVFRDVTGGTVPLSMDAIDGGDGGRIGIGIEDAQAHLDITKGASFSRIDAGATTFTASSSRNLKTNINKAQVENILKRISLVPVTTYNWKAGDSNSDDLRTDVMGLIAEDFYTVLQRGSDKSINGQEVQMALWMGVQELHKNTQELEDELVSKNERIVALEDQVKSLDARLNEISELLSSNKQDILINTDGRAVLGQNFPNPYNQQTTIEYFLPENVKSAEVHLFDVAGKLMKTIAINQTGKGQLNLKASDLPSGQYSYSLVVGSEVVDSKKMILSR